MRLKDVAFVNLRTLDESTQGDYKFRYIDISSVSADNGINLGDEITFQEAPSRARRIVKKRRCPCIYRAYIFESYR